MIATIYHNSKEYKVDLSKPLDISIPMGQGENNVSAWYLKEPEITPHVDGNFVGSIAQGATVNFNNIWFNPHAHVTHTECVGHITKKTYSVNRHLKNYFFLAELVTVAPEKHNGDLMISKKQLQYALGNLNTEALIIRTLPNTKGKMNKKYSNSNPPYLSEESAIYLREKGVVHLLIDLPSVDKEKDDGRLLAHKSFWNLKGKVRHNATITEFIYVDNSIEDGSYFMNLQVAPIENDASPSRPVLYSIL